MLCEIFFQIICNDLEEIDQDIRFYTKENILYYPLEKMQQVIRKDLTWPNFSLYISLRPPKLFWGLTFTRKDGAKGRGIPSVNKQINFFCNTHKELPGWWFLWDFCSFSKCSWCGWRPDICSTPGISKISGFFGARNIIIFNSNICDEFLKLRGYKAVQAVQAVQFLIFRS